MRGTIQTQHLITHAGMIVRLFGVRVYLRCLLNIVRHGGRATFLEALR
ncbi:MAG: hypothetical protein JW751_03175 [Polyangiaceae bacterium]|nr:hypothetical protein [Polyangiaceae bacterium]